MNWVAAREGVTIALDALWSNKVRAALTILGIVIGVATVMAMAAVITGIRSGVMEDVAAAGPRNFVVSRIDQSQIRFDQDFWAMMRRRPRITLEEAALASSVPSVQSVTAAVDGSSELKWGSQTFSGIQVLGRGWQWPNYTQGDFVAGRNYLPAEEMRSAPVVVISHDMAESVFEGADVAIGKTVRLGGHPFLIVGVYRLKPNLFSAMARNLALTPHTTALKLLGVQQNGMQLLVVPVDNVGQEQVMDDVTASLRVARGLRPGEENNFAVVRSEAFAELFDRLTGVFFLVMLVLSSIGLMVGGVGVVAIMMISVTERTREIGVRKALGATRREILWQFLVESMTVTVIGGALGLLLGGAGALLLSMVSPIPASIPLWSVFAALVVFAVSGIGFGLYPANKAARLDPVEALRYE
ncbi:MAG: ABC transporter permease [Gemmatimonadota bacterium]|nr:ABC transporter permease [Gemmatimonadota bacterium]